MVRYITEHDSPNFTPAAKCRARFGQPRTVESITIHWWGDPATKPSFDGVVSHLCRRAGTSSAHYVIDAGRAACIVDPDDAAWHAGSRTGNATSIGLELDPRATDDVYATAAEVIADLRRTYGDLPLVPHKHWKNTACPGVFDLARLDSLARGVATPAPAKPAPAPAKPAPAKPAPAPTSPALKRGSTGTRVERLQRTLKTRYPLYAKHLAVDGDYGPKTEAAVREFQFRAGLAVDGIAGPATHRALGLTY
ncbi:N-acetylmuramoyl-L-alanine amidase [Cellulosimicrobium sp. ES-005]|uniref:N-acetylmuramoyl-L-alanine amidase n=1 Tax=Cellulosimicrobium sp. ES-005 TaxID=3163031 RepID=A0AAU8G3F3_9MICO